MGNNITKANDALRRSSFPGDSAEVRQAEALTGIGQALVALAKGIATIGAVMYLTHVEKNRGARVSEDAGVQGLEEKIHRGLDL